VGLHRRELRARVLGDPAILSPPNVALRFARPKKSESPVQLERKLQGVRSACGCLESFLGLLFGMGIFVIHSRTHAVPSVGLTHEIMTGVGFALSGATIGKILGLARARSRYGAAAIAPFRRDTD
jgi:hypothetical protein